MRLRGEGETYPLPVRDRAGFSRGMSHRASIPPPLSLRDRDRLSALVRRLGERRAVEILDMPRATLARCMAGLGVRRATAEVLAARLDQIADRSGAAAVRTGAGASR